MTQPDISDDLHTRLSAFVGRRYGPYRAWDPVNAPMIRQWREAIRIEGGSGEGDPAGPDPDIAPRSMINVWMMRGVGNARPPDSVSDDPYELVQLLRDAGYVGVIATRSRQDYVRDLRAGERVSSMVTVDSVSPRKATKLGTGYFVVLRHDYLVGDEPVAAMRFTTLHYAPQPKETPRPPPPQPGISDDTRFFWDGLRQDKLLVQRCDACGRLQHPPGPVCTACHGLALTPVEVAGRGTVYSWTVVHHPQHPAFDYPHIVGVVDLECGQRLIAPLDRFTRDSIAAGAPVEIRYRNVEGENRLPVFVPAGGGA